MIKVHISEFFFADQIKIHVVRHHDIGRDLLHYSSEDQTLTWTRIDDGSSAVTEAPAPTLALPGEAGRALLDALTRYYHGADDTRALRRDYDAERKRVDEQAAVIADIARTLANR